MSDLIGEPTPEQRKAAYATIDDTIAQSYRMGLCHGGALTLELANFYGWTEAAESADADVARNLSEAEQEILYDAFQRVVALRIAPADASTLPAPSEPVSGCHRAACEVCAASLVRTRPRASASARPHNARATAPHDDEHEDAERETVTLVIGDDPRANFREFLDSLSAEQDEAVTMWLLADSRGLRAMLAARLAKPSGEAA